MAQVYVSLGSNIERRKHIAAALGMLRERFGALEQSSIYESDAVGFDSDPFYNLVVGFETGKDPGEIQELLREIEDANGRVRTGSMDARTLDLDLLMYDELVVEEPGLRLPREDITRYAFVLGPLAEIAGARRHPLTGQRLDVMWRAFADPRQVLKPVAWSPQFPD